MNTQPKIASAINGNKKKISPKFALILVAAIVAGAAYFIFIIKPESGIYPASARAEFIEECTTSGSGESKKFCTCVLNNIEQNVTYEEYQGVQKLGETGDVSRNFIGILGVAYQKCKS